MTFLLYKKRIDRTASYWTNIDRNDESRSGLNLLALIFVRLLSIDRQRERDEQVFFSV